MAPRRMSKTLGAKIIIAKTQPPSSGGGAFFLLTF
jgi:hypothetical protein